MSQLQRDKVPNAQDGGDRRSDGIHSELVRHKFELMKRPTSDGVTEMGTGDKLVKDGDREILFMPNGDKLTVNKDGSFDLKTKGAVEVKKQGDMTTVTYPNGDKVLFGKNGVETITRGNTTVEILDKNMFNFPHDNGPIFPGPSRKPVPSIEHHQQNLLPNSEGQLKNFQTIPEQQRK